MQIRWSGIPIFVKNFPQLIVIHTVKGFGTFNKAEVDVFLELSHFFDDPMDVDNLISGSSVFSKSSLNLCNFTVHVLLKPGLDNVEHFFASMWDECNLAVVWAFFSFAFLWDWNENWSFPVLWQCWVFQTCWHIECNTFTASTFRIWNSSTGFPTPLLALLVVMIPKDHLTFHSWMYGSRWVITPSWLSGSWRAFLYSSSVYSCRFILTSASVSPYYVCPLSCPSLHEMFPWYSNFPEDFQSFPSIAFLCLLALFP